MDQKDIDIGIGMGRKTKQNLKFTIITFGIMAVITIVLIFVFVGGGRRTVRISDYIRLAYTGMNGGGMLDVAVDREALYKKMAGEEKNAVLLRSIDTFIDGIMVVPDKTSKLNNGEEIHIKIEYDKELAKKINCRLYNTEYTVTASGFGNGQVIDIFANVDVVVAGISPSAYVNVVNRWQEDYLKDIPFSLSKSTNIESGDVITVTCEADDRALSDIGISIYEKTKEFKVDKIDVYVRSADELDRQIVTGLVEECAETIRIETEDLTFRMLYKATRDSSYLFQYNNEWVNETVLYSARFLYRRDGRDVKNTNYLELIFKSDISNGASDETVYFVFEFSDIYISSDKTFQITKGDLKNRYICDIDHEKLYGSVISSKEDSYVISEIDWLND